MTMRNKLLLCFLLLVASVSAQEVRQDTLLKKDLAIDLVLRKNFDIEVSQNNLEVADNNQGILNSGYFKPFNCLCFLQAECCLYR